MIFWAIEDKKGKLVKYAIGDAPLIFMAKKGTTYLRVDRGKGTQG